MWNLTCYITFLTQFYLTLIYTGHKWPDSFHYTAQGQNLIFYMLLNNQQCAIFHTKDLHPPLFRTRVSRAARTWSVQRIISILCNNKLFFFSNMSRVGWGTALCLAKLIKGVLSPGVKQPGREAILLPQRTADTNNGCSNTSIPIWSLWHTYVRFYLFLYLTNPWLLWYGVLGKLVVFDIKLKLCVDIIILEDKNLNKVQSSILNKISKHQCSLHLLVHPAVFVSAKE